jgi:hypothetical protein
VDVFALKSRFWQNFASSPTLTDSDGPADMTWETIEDVDVKSGKVKLNKASRIRPRRLLWRQPLAKARQYCLRSRPRGGSSEATMERLSRKMRKNHGSSGPSMAVMWGKLVE